MIGFIIEIASERCAFILGCHSMMLLLAMPMVLFCARLATVDSLGILMVSSQAGNKSNLLATGRQKGQAESFLFGGSGYSPGYSYACHTRLALLTCCLTWWTAAPPILAPFFCLL